MNEEVRELAIKLLLELKQETVEKIIQEERLSEAITKAIKMVESYDRT